MTTEEFRSGATVSYTDASSGLVAIDDDQEVAGVRIPFAQSGALPVWADVDEERGSHLPWLSNGLVCGFFHNGFTARGMYLAAHPIVVAGLDFHLAPWPDYLHFQDKHGKRALVLRTWKANAIDASVNGNVYRFSGCDLMLRADCFTSLKDQIESRIVMVTRVDRRQHDSWPQGDQ
jgi:hypothetical protein